MWWDVDIWTVEMLRCWDVDVVRCWHLKCWDVEVLRCWHLIFWCWDVDISHYFQWKIPLRGTNLLNSSLNEGRFKPKRPSLRDFSYLFYSRIGIFLFTNRHRVASAARSDCVRRPIRLRPPSDRIAFAVRLDSVRVTMQIAGRGSLKLGSSWLSVAEVSVRRHNQ